MHSFLPVAGLLSILTIAGWIVYRFLENLGDTLPAGATVESRLARKNATGGGAKGAAISWRREFRVTPASVGDELAMGEPVRFDALVTKSENRQSFKQPVRVATAPLGHYPRVIYQCPVRATASARCGDDASFAVITPELYDIKADKAS